MYKMETELLVFLSDLFLLTILTETRENKIILPATKMF